MQIPPLRRASASPTLTIPPHSRQVGSAESGNKAKLRPGGRAEDKPRWTHSAGASQAPAAPAPAGQLPDRALAPQPWQISWGLQRRSTAHTPQTPSGSRVSGTPSRPPRAHQRDACGAAPARRAAVTPPRLHARAGRPSSGTHVHSSTVEGRQAQRPTSLASVPAALPSVAEIGLPEDEEHRTEHGRAAHAQCQHQGLSGRGASILRGGRVRECGLRRPSQPACRRWPHSDCLSRAHPTQPTQPHYKTHNACCRDRRRELGARPGALGPPPTR